MTTTNSGSSSVEGLQAELTIARNEIKNLRKHIATLNQIHRSDVQHIVDTLEHFRVGNYSPTIATPGTKLMPVTTTPTTNHHQQSDDVSSSLLPNGNNALSNSPSFSNAVLPHQPYPFQPIGTIRTAFPEKRAVPRQPTIGQQLTGTIELSIGSPFTNPEHAIDGLQQFSHMWIIYHFHRNAPGTHAKVEPPRLRGERVGVFSTRSPHRPCPIGLSLVEIVRIDGRRILFRGTDMVDGTPVLDIKPYIPRYDAPAALLRNDGGPEPRVRHQGRQQQLQHVAVETAAALLQRSGRLSSREEPDGEESVEMVMVSAGSGGGGGGRGVGTAAVCDDPAAASRNDEEGNNEATDVVMSVTDAIIVPIRVPDWIMDEPTLEVLFNERAEAELSELNIERSSIVDVMAEDPRSVYLRTKYGSQIFTFQLGEVTVTCKFDDPAASVTIVRIRRTQNLPAQEQETTDTKIAAALL